MVRYKKQFAVLFGAIAMISYLSFRFFPNVEAPNVTSVVAVNEKRNYLQVYLMDRDRNLVPLSIPINEEMNQEEKLQVMVSYMSGKQDIKGFHKVFQKDCKLLKVAVKNRVASLYFDSSFKDYKKEDELRVLESIVWGSTQFDNIDQVRLFMQNKELQFMPNANTPIPKMLSRNIGINHFETSTKTLHNSTSLTVFYTKKIEGQQYMVPKSKRIENYNQELKTSVEEIVSDISASSKLSQPLYSDDIKIVNFELYDGNMVVNINKNIIGSNRMVKQDIYDAVVLSLASLPGIKTLELKVDGVHVGLPNQKTDMVSIYDVSYNEVKF